MMANSLLQKRKTAAIRKSLLKRTLDPKTLKRKTRNQKSLKKRDLQSQKRARAAKRIDLCDKERATWFYIDMHSL